MDIEKIETLQETLPSKSEINRKVAVMILPITIEGILEMISGIINMGMIGRIDVFAVSALGIGIQIMELVWALLKGISMGETVFVARYYGAGDKKRMLSVMQQTIFSVMVVALLTLAVVFIGARQILCIYSPKPEIMELALTYLRTICFGFPFLAIMLAVAGAFQGMGNAHTPMIIAAIMNVVNIAVGYTLIFGRFGFQPMGVRGAAIATASSQAVAAILGLIIMFRKKGILRGYLNRKFFSVNIKELLDIYRVGIQSAAETIFWIMAGIIVARAIMTFGETAFAAYQLGVQAESISYMPAAGFGIAATAFIGQSLGAGNPKLAKLYMKQIMKEAMIITGVSVTLLLLIPRSIMSLLTNNMEVVKLGAIYLIMAGMVQIPQNAAGVFGGAMKGAGFARMPMLAAAVGIWGIRVPFTLIITYIIRLPVFAIWAAIDIDLVCRFILCFIFIRKY
ncbi:MAG: MATE family efflux transporter, partial [Bacillota bacterium]|nr:MATE family efflux transporter [Bacillota bacterium]